jgi:diguanylate cyclase (GGDEF)-like protein
MRKFIRAWALMTAGGTAIYTAWVFTSHFAPDIEDTLSSALLVLFNLSAGILGGYIAFHKSQAKPIRAAWLLMGLAAFANMIAEVLWFVFRRLLGIDPFPSVADVFYLLYYPLMLVGILSLPFLPIERHRRLLVGLDMSIIMVVGALFLWYFILAPIRVSGSEGLAGAIALAYPIADLFLIAGILSLMQREVENVGRVVLALLGVSMFSTLIADVLFAIFETYSQAYFAPALNILWMLAAWAMLAAAAWQAIFLEAETGRVESFRPLLRTSLLYFALVMVAALVIAASVTLTGHFDARLYGAIIGAFIVAFLVLLRQHFLLKDNQQMFQRMEFLAITDALTGLYNRHYFNTAIVQEIKRAERYKRPLSILMMDVDNFKAYNDTYGHLEGDILLHNIAELLRSRMRVTDLLARFGGDEFVAILPETNAEQAQAVARKIEQTMAGRYKQHNLGMSIGIALLQPGLSATSLLAEADRQLYLVKPKHKKENGA